MKLRIKFQKYGSMRYVGHLDLMRFFQKAIRRAEIDIRYTQGFHPHPIMAFAAPLGMNLCSDAEYFDIELLSGSPPEVIIDRLNLQMTEGIEVSDACILSDDAKNAMAAVAAADYTITFREGILSGKSSDEMKDLVHAYYEMRESIPITKKTKKSERSMDLKPLIYRFEAKEGGVFLCVSTGSIDNIKPELVLKDFCRFFNIPYDRYTFTVTRNEIYAASDRDLIPLIRFGAAVS